MTIQDAGNSILRAALSRPLLSEVIAHKLLAARKLTEGEWESSLESSLEEAQSVFPSFSDHILIVDRTRVINASWKRACVYRSPSLSFEMVEHVANNLDTGEAIAHVHEGEEFLVVLSGTVRVRIMDEAITLHAGESLHFAGRDPHLTLPLVQDARVLSINVPPWSDSTAELSAVALPAD